MTALVGSIFLVFWHHPHEARLRAGGSSVGHPLCTRRGSTKHACPGPCTGPGDAVPGFLCLALPPSPAFPLRGSVTEWGRVKAHETWTLLSWRCPVVQTHVCQVMAHTCKMRARNGARTSP